MCTVRRINKSWSLNIRTWATAKWQELDKQEQIRHQNSTTWVTSEPSVAASRLTRPTPESETRTLESAGARFARKQPCDAKAAARLASDAGLCRSSVFPAAGCHLTTGSAELGGATLHSNKGGFQQLCTSAGLHASSWGYCSRVDHYCPTNMSLPQVHHALKQFIVP